MGVLRLCSGRRSMRSMQHLNQEAIQKRGPGKLEKLFASDDMWVVK